MPSYEEWSKIDEGEDEELQDTSFYEGKRDVILFCIDCSESMQELYDDPNYEGIKTCHLYTALEAAMQIQKKKIISGPSDSVGILLFNTTRKTNTSRNQGSEIKKYTSLYQSITLLGAQQIQGLIELLDAAREDPNELRTAFPPLVGQRVPTGDVFTSCNWIFRDGAPMTATKRIFLITDEDDPHPGKGSKQLIMSARTTLIDLVQSGVAIEPFFISTEEKAFDVSKFYSSVLLPTNLIDEDEIQEDPTVLPESISITRVEELLAQMRFHEVPKRALFSVPFQLAEGFTMSVKGYSLITEQKKGDYKYFVDLGDRMEVAMSRTVYMDESQEAEVDKGLVLYGVPLGVTGGADEEEETEDVLSATRIVRAGQRPYYTADEIRSFRTLGLEPIIKLLGFKDRNVLEFEDNVKHSLFIYPDETRYSGSRRTFTALLRSMISKKKIALALVVSRRNASPVFCALLPQAESMDDGGWKEPPGIHLIPLPFADDIRAAPIQEGFKASDDLKDAARAWIDKLSVKNGTYPSDSFPNPALAYHNAQLEASAFREQFDPESFEDLTHPKYAAVHKRSSDLIQAWKRVLGQEEASTTTIVAGTKRKAEEATDALALRMMCETNTLYKLRVDQLKEFLKSKGESVSGKKAELLERATAWFKSHPSD